ncbi:transcriptional protein SWT1 [Alligator mississippiensis]|uniref:transcriptional protein SWT1 n=1 Tax=Alligator mississippiensis TaxID=8496 RepID=UPI002877C08A|nr:transcriptional protein SWT1 [Alligator mississippiensis]
MHPWLGETTPPSVHRVRLEESCTSQRAPRPPSGKTNKLHLPAYIAAGPRDTGVGGALSASRMHRGGAPRSSSCAGAEPGFEMSKKKPKKSSREDGLDDLDSKKSGGTGISNSLKKEKLEFQRFKVDNSVKEKQNQSSVSQSTDERFQSESSNSTKTTNDSSILSGKRGKITIQFKHKDTKHEKNACDSGVVPDSKKSCNKDRHFEGRGERKIRPSFAVQKDKLMKKKKKKKKEKAELNKLKARVEQTMLEKFTTATCQPHLLRKKSHSSKKCSDDFRIPKKSSTFPEAKVDGPPSNASGSSFMICKEEGLGSCKELSNKNHNAIKYKPSCYSTEIPKRWEYHKQTKQQAESNKTAGTSKTEKRNLEVKPLHLKQSFEVPCSSASPEASQNSETDQEMQIIEDLHAARIDRKMVLPVVQTCGELTSMEIDLPEQDANISAADMTSGLNLLIVIDTNIMISHLKFIRTLKTEDIPGVGRLALIIPWVVLQELDNLKKGKMVQHVRDKAIPAVQFIYTCLKNQDSKLWGQSMQLASQKIYGLSDENNDDRVLQCCLQYRSLFPQAVVILCTDDKNLCNKALVSEVKALCKTDLVAALRNLNANNLNSHQDIPQQSETDAVSQEAKKDCNLPDPFSSIILNLEKSLGEALSSILETEMKIAFGNLWMEILYLKPPWTLADLLQCYKKHWFAVFGQVVPRRLFATIEYLHNHLCKGKNLMRLLFLRLVTFTFCKTISFSMLIPLPGKMIDSLIAGTLLRESKKLLHAFSSRSDYDGVLPQAFTQVNKLLQSLEEVSCMSLYIGLKQILDLLRTHTTNYLSEQVLINCSNGTAYCFIFFGSTSAALVYNCQRFSALFCVKTLRIISSLRHLFYDHLFHKDGSDHNHKSEAPEDVSENAACEKMEDVTLHQQTCEEGKSLSDAQLARDNRHLQIWSVLESVWNTINLYSIDIFQKLNPSIISTIAKTLFEEAFLGLQKLMAAVNDILEGIRRILTPNSNFEDIWTLYNFLNSNEINSSIKFTAEELYDCVSQEVYRERLTVGCYQLAQLEAAIKQCNTSVHIEVKNRGWL